MRLEQLSALDLLRLVCVVVELLCLECECFNREPRLRQVSKWKDMLPWFDPPTAKFQPNNPFFVVWNSPTFRCGRRYGLPMELEKFGICANDMELFHGDVINLFYEGRLGLYPKMLRNGRSFNGGIPQLANFTAHLEWVKEDLDWYIPNKTYDGLAVIDWEAWRPLFERNYTRDKKRYALRALAVVQSKYPWWHMYFIKRKAKEEFDAAARRLMDATASLCQKLRPNAKWGYYLFPSCFNNRPGQNYCTRKTIQRNDRLSWLFKKSKALYPSIYLKQQQHPEYQRLYVEGALRETYRVTTRHAGRDVFVIPYTRYTYSNNKEFYSKSDLESTIGQAADSGAAGVVLWESTKNIQHKSDCKKIHKYLHAILGPFVRDVLTFTKKCSFHLCGGHGRCVSRQWNNYGLVNWKPRAHKRRRNHHRRSPRSVPDYGRGHGDLAFESRSSHLKMFQLDVNNSSSTNIRRIFNSGLGHNHNVDIASFESNKMNIYDTVPAVQHPSQRRSMGDAGDKLTRKSHRNVPADNDGFVNMEPDRWRRGRNYKVFKKKRPHGNESVKRHSYRRKRIKIKYTPQFRNYVCRCYDGWAGQFCRTRIGH